jgi:hypothetical protein
MKIDKISNGLHFAVICIESSTFSECIWHLMVIIENEGDVCLARAMNARFAHI